MKRFNADGPGNGLFEFATSSRQLDLSQAETTSSASNVRAATWDSNIPAPTTSVEIARTTKSGIYRSAGKRALDTLAILISLPFALPIIGLCALALWIEGGSPIYKQTRIGKNGKLFSILKLRTMVQNADQVLEDYLAKDPAMRAEWDTLQKLKNDPRVTRVGGLLRATSLDELPQLINVLKGDMSLVGPRPMMVEQEEMYGDMRAYEALRPGITGLWQVSARNGNTFRYRNEVDATYESEVTLRRDFSILLKTVGVVMRRTGY